MYFDHTSSQEFLNYKLYEDELGPVDPTMGGFYMADEDEQLLSRWEPGWSKDINFCFRGALLLPSWRRLRARSKIAASSFVLLTFLILSALLFVDDSKRPLLRNGLSFSQILTLNPSSDSALRHGNTTLLTLGHSYVEAIMTPENTSFPRLECPSPSTSRYTYLQQPSSHEHDTVKLPSYFFALDLHQCVSILPRLMGSIVESIQFLGPENCVLSVVEGRSNDGTYEALKLLKAEIESMGARYFFTSNNINPGKEDKSANRISALAELRNIALLPLVEHAKDYSPNATVVFLNDVAICMEDILELIHQRHHQTADMICAMDWTFVGPDPTFYDVWIARGMNGDSFFNIPADGNWNSAWNLFWNNPIAQHHQRAGQPFQVFSCWNGAVAFTAKPLLEGKLRFRSSRPDECFQGEPRIFAKDMWWGGYGKIAVVPSVNLEYSDEAARKIKALKGYVSEWVGAGRSDVDMRIEWEETPPERVKCMPSYNNQTWRPWDEGLGS